MKIRALLFISAFQLFSFSAFSQTAVSPLSNQIVGPGSSRVKVKNDGSIEVVTASGQPFLAYSNSNFFNSGTWEGASSADNVVSGAGQFKYRFTGTNMQVSVNGGAFNNVLTGDLLGANSGIATLDGAGKLTSTQIPYISIAVYRGSKAGQAAMLATSPANPGDWVIRSDLSTTWVVTGDPTQLSGWTQLGYPTVPVTSVNGNTGAVSLQLANTIASTSHKWLASYDATTGNFTSSQPAIVDLSDAGQLANWAAIATSTKEPAITAGTSSQYWRGDKTFQTLNQAAVAGLTTSDDPTFNHMLMSGNGFTNTKTYEFSSTSPSFYVNSGGYYGALQSSSTLVTLASNSKPIIIGGNSTEQIRIGSSAAGQTQGVAIGTSTLNGFGTLNISGDTTIGGNTTVSGGTLNIKSTNHQLVGDFGGAGLKLVVDGSGFAYLRNVGNRGFEILNGLGYSWSSNPGGSSANTGIQRSSDGNVGFTNGGATTYFAVGSNGVLLGSGITQSTTMTAGFVQIPGAAGAPTGVPNNTTGFPMYWDSTNLQLCVYTGGAWKKSAAFN